ncbi:bombesin receptor subtype-3 [Biomphalaria glabrata]|uniref:Neuropeptide CCHamide-1 receptor-like n=1 Tax=Biomphalaria glabrata TaxID=6526 RepID=A0A9W3AP82_BIOGL|nr:neuropeptide CCHamide-1 receptor-like [Biomphalaria glabrata]XP_055889052.1 neuropeptide CCHamide-1 receptor-like [Biomphalaria glabrata]KAI8752823.1 bombesin receptor subtype-3 [Biomphalaria glabrata]
MEVTEEQASQDRFWDCNTSTPMHNCTERLLEYPTPEAIAVPCVFAVILVVGLIGNLLLILSFAQHKSLTTTHNMLVVNLASGDFIFLIVSLPFNSIWYTLSYWPFGLVLCKLSFFAESLATTVVVATLSVLSVERCLIVMGKKLWRHQRREPILLTLGIWALAIAVSMPTLLSATISSTTSSEKYVKQVCSIYDTKWGMLYVKIHVGLRFVILFCLPLLVIAVAYSVIAVHLLLRAFPLSDRRRLAGNQNSKYQNSIKSELKGQDPNSPKKQQEVNHKPEEDITTGNGIEDNTAKSKECLIDPKSKVGTRNHTSTEKSTIDRKPSSEISQSTQVCPNSFVYTGPIPTMDVPYQRKTIASDTTGKPEDTNNTLSPTASPKLSKETTPLTTEVRLVGTKFAQPGRPQSMVNKRRRLALTVLMLILAFALCWTPRHAYFLWYFLHPNGSYNSFWHIFQIVAFCLSFSNSAVNPLVFYILDNKFRSYVHSSLCAICWKCCKRGQAPGTEAIITLGERDYNATVAPTKSKESVTQL